MPVIRPTSNGRTSNASAHAWFGEQIDTVDVYTSPELAVDGCQWLSFWFFQYDNQPPTRGATVTLQFSFLENGGGTVWRNLDNPIILSPGAVRPPTMAFTYILSPRLIRVIFTSTIEDSFKVDYVMSAKA